MLGEVIAFGLILVLFEFVILCMVPPRTRLRMLANESAKVAISAGMLILNLWVHWGTVVGTMSATLSFITSLTTLSCAKVIFGAITEDRYYTVGWVKYSKEELK